MTTIGVIFEIVIAAVLALSWIYLAGFMKSLSSEVSKRGLQAQEHHDDKLLAAVKAGHARELKAVRAGHANELEIVKAEHARRGEEFTLFARERHRAYPRVYRRYRVAADKYMSLLGFHMGPDFSTFIESDLDEYLRKNQLALKHGEFIRAAIAAGQFKDSGRMLDELDLKVQRRDAMRAFGKAKNVETLEDLYLSDAVRAQLTLVRNGIAKFSVTQDRRPNQPSDPDEWDKRNAMNDRVDELFAIMREELRREDKATAPPEKP